ncbi:RRM-6 domain containing protein [Pyrenophora tritici-repentis]|uniref:RRM-6 domain containing protein n=1 Tax=Pyrenophora tritici-repentis TaxID=45151 RepID=A0A2W1F3X1_9PLEO|nr:hypothetical protein PtrV1_12466 [Pyrenophora tritici-repentis]KAF7445268.1 hypothetical protein A1F99_102540 [Pyrenophora tritici-repentis]KAF7565533.1 RRM-6 domain containing protein [Pyrenophora tritici-repentis]KAG9380339.1 hypothetical protein A1F94_009234 [Pyrenophora tritici-repentis]KAI0580714.1 hypothetical protein Alg215_05050 [Pyrenophora tritici-repentis]
MEYVGHTGSASMLVLRLTNVHMQADKRTICRYFDGYRILDQIRAMNPKTRTRSAVYVMFGSVEDKNRAHRTLNLGTILGRQIHLMPAQNGNYRINCTHNGFVHDEDKGPAVVTTSELPALNVLSGSEFPVLGRSTPVSSLSMNLPMEFVHHEDKGPAVFATSEPPALDVLLGLELPVMGRPIFVSSRPMNLPRGIPIPMHGSPEYVASNSCASHQKRDEVVNRIGPVDTLPKEVTPGGVDEPAAMTDAPLKRDEPAVMKDLPKKREEQKPSHEQPVVFSGIEQGTFSRQMPPSAEKTSKPDPLYAHASENWFLNLPKVVQDYYSSFGLPPPNPAFLDPTVNAVPNPPPPRGDFFKPALLHTPPRDDFSKPTLGHTSNPDIRENENTGEPVTDTVPKEKDILIEPLGGLWNLSGNDDPTANVICESEWYTSVPHLMARNLDALDTISRRIDREGGHGGGSGDFGSELHVTLSLR